MLRRHGALTRSLIAHPRISHAPLLSQAFDDSDWETWAPVASMPATDALVQLRKLAAKKTTAATTTSAKPSNFFRSARNDCASQCAAAGDAGTPGLLDGAYASGAAGCGGAGTNGATGGLGAVPWSVCSVQRVPSQ